jgi:adenosine deaminase
MEKMMENLECILGVLFQKVATEDVVKGYISGTKFKKEDFVKLAFYYMQQYSESELENMWMFYYSTFVAERKNFEKEYQARTQGFNVFDALFYFVKRVLIIQDNEIVCRYERIQEWRKLTLELSEDLLVCAYCAATKTIEEMRRIGFAWKVVIGHNNVQLNHILERGISENHFHLYGSAPVFHLSWISLMNHITSSSIIEKLKNYDNNRRNRNEDKNSLVFQCYQAAFIRKELFYLITEGRKRDCPIWNILSEEYGLNAALPDIQREIDVLQYPDIETKKDNKPLVDYALQGVIGSQEDQKDIFSGERWLLYSCFQKINGNEFSEDEENLVYLYLLAKEHIRAEMVQSNNKVGFVNFEKYQDRKKDLLDAKIFNNEMVRRAVRDCLLSGNVCSLELRITPGATIEKNKKKICELDQIIGEPKDKYFYTVHFIKEADDEVQNEDVINCRNYSCRKKAKKQANALIGFREQYPEIASRILGIDAASNEIGCRPEVFASEFRRLKNHIKMIEDREEKRLYVPQLKVTYHVGEDFLDLADGLRAIDEAVNFLNLDYGDRLGHAIALGIDVDEWYASKNDKILISQQDYLDNLVWIYQRLVQFRVEGVDALKDYIERKYEQLFGEIYGQYMDYERIQFILKEAKEKYESLGKTIMLQNDRYSFDIGRYYEAWKLRGDDPELYKNGYFCWEDDGSPEKRAQVNTKFPKNFAVRYLPANFLLYYCYHFDEKVRKTGNQKREVKIKPDYKKAVSLIQKEMQKRIGQRGIFIETNPSSNFAIGTFKDYKKHPIFNLYNRHLTFEQEKLKNCPQLSVSVNTDDQGIFATSLENEYALLASALDFDLDEDGKNKYNRNMVYEWLDDVRKMGNEQSFLHRVPSSMLSKEDMNNKEDTGIYIR